MRVLITPYLPASSWLDHTASSHVLSFLSVPSRTQAVKRPHGHPKGGVPLRWRPLRSVLPLGWVCRPLTHQGISRELCIRMQYKYGHGSAISTAWICDTLLGPASPTGGHQIWLVRQRSALIPRSDGIAGLR